MHLLVIEDERALCETIVRSMRRAAYSVDYCCDGEEALELLEIERKDIEARRSFSQRLFSKDETISSYIPFRHKHILFSFVLRVCTVSNHDLHSYIRK